MTTTSRPKNREGQSFVCPSVIVNLSTTKPTRAPAPAISNSSMEQAGAGAASRTTSHHVVWRKHFWNIKHLNPFTLYDQKLSEAV